MDLAMLNWVKGLSDNRGVLKWDTQQFTAQITIISALTLGVVDISSYIILLDMRMAEALDIPVKQAKSGQLECYIALGEWNCVYTGA